MESNIFIQAAKFLRERRDNRRWKAVVFCLAVVVIGATAWLLTRKSQALTHPGGVLDCPAVVHVHTADCFDENGNPVCGKADYIFHIHSDGCYDADGGLVCPLPEVEPHVHDKDCFITEKTLVCGYGEDSTEPSSRTESPAEGETQVPESPAEGETQVPAPPAKGEIQEPESPAEGELQALAAEAEGEPQIPQEEESRTTQEAGGKELICTKEEHTHGADC